jgi:hypothetical protein
MWACGGKDTPVLGRVAKACSPLANGARRDGTDDLSPDIEFGTRHREALGAGVAAAAAGISNA